MCVLVFIAEHFVVGWFDDSSQVACTSSVFGCKYLISSKATTVKEESIRSSASEKDEAKYKFFPLFECFNGRWCRKSANYGTLYRMGLRMGQKGKKSQSTASSSRALVVCAFPFIQFFFIGFCLCCRWQTEFSLVHLQNFSASFQFHK